MKSKRVLFVCGSINQTTQMHQIAKVLPELEASFSPFFAGAFYDLCRKAKLIEWTILGNRLRHRCLDYLNRHHLQVDLEAQCAPYDLIVNCTDIVVAPALLKTPMVLVQEGIMDPPNGWLPAIQRFPQMIPRWYNGTAATGLSFAYERFCVASQGYLSYFASIGVPRERMVVTGIPNFDDCRRYCNNDFPHRHFVLVCTSDARETFKKDDRDTLIRYATELARGRQLIFKLHPNENFERARAEIRNLAPEALVYQEGSAEEMIANCDVFVGQYSSTAFVAMALNKEVHSYWGREELRRLLPEQNGCAAAKIANVCRSVIQDHSDRVRRLPPARPRLRQRHLVHAATHWLTQQGSQG